MLHPDAPGFAIYPLNAVSNSGLMQSPPRTAINGGGVSISRLLNIKHMKLAQCAHIAILGKFVFPQTTRRKNETVPDYHDVQSILSFSP